MDKFSKCTIVMYHYVRPIKSSPYTQLKGLEVEGFKRQLDYLQSKYTIISANDLIDSVTSLKKLPVNSCLLTFDDGYKDHVDYVLPILLARGITAAFFPPARAVLYREMLDVNSLHFILNCVDNLDALVPEMEKQALGLGVDEFELKKFKNIYCKPGRYDNANVIYLKRMLQFALPREIRSQILTTLFDKHVAINQTDFANELYLSLDDVKKLLDNGMYVGNHGYNHDWLNNLTLDQQKNEITLSLDFLSQVGARTSKWIMCYPYGAYNSTTINILRSMDCVIGLTTAVGVADLDPSNSFELKRFDTNDFPQ